MIDAKIEPIEVQLEKPQLFRELTDSITYWVSVRIKDVDAATAANYGPFFIAPFPCTVIDIQEIHATAGSNGSAVSLFIEKLTGTTAKGSGISLNTAINLKGTANTVQYKSKLNVGLVTTVTNSVLDISLQRGDRLALKTSGTLTAVNDVVVTIALKTDIGNLII